MNTVIIFCAIDNKKFYLDANGYKPNWLLTKKGFEIMPEDTKWLDLSLNSL